MSNGRGESRETPCVGCASGSDGAAEGAGEPRAGTGTGDGKGQTASEGAGQGGSRGGMPQTQTSKGFDVRPAEASVVGSVQMTHDLCAGYQKFWCHESSGVLPVIVVICLAAIATWTKFAPGATNGTGTNRWIRKDTPARNHAPKVWLRRRRGRVPKGHLSGRPLGRPRHRWQGSHRTAAQCPLCTNVDAAGPRGRHTALQRAGEDRQKRRSFRGETHASRRAASEVPLETEVNEEGLVHNHDGCGITTVLYVDPVGTPAVCCF